MFVKQIVKVIVLYSHSPYKDRIVVSEGCMLLWWVELYAQVKKRLTQGPFSMESAYSLSHVLGIGYSCECECE